MLKRMIFAAAMLTAMVGPSAPAQTFNDAARAQMCRNGMQAYCQPERRRTPEASRQQTRSIDPSRYIQSSARRAASVDPGECAMTAAKYLGQFNLTQPTGWPRRSDERIRSYLADPGLVEAMTDTLTCARVFAQESRGQIEREARRQSGSRDFIGFSQAVEPTLTRLKTYKGAGAAAAAIQSALEFTAQYGDQDLRSSAAELAGIWGSDDFAEQVAGFNPYVMDKQSPAYRGLRTALVDHIDAGLTQPQLRALYDGLAPVALAERDRSTLDFDFADQGEYRRSLVRRGESPLEKARDEPSMYNIYALIVAEADPVTSRRGVRERDQRLAAEEATMRGATAGPQGAVQMNPRLPYELDKYMAQWGIDRRSLNGPWCTPPANSTPVGPSDLSETAKLMLQVAQAKTILILSHGQTVDQPGWGRKREDLERQWAPYVASARRMDPDTAYCLVNWNTDEGLQSMEGKILPMLVLLRMMTDDPALYRPDRTITLTGYSSGANYSRLFYLIFRNAPILPDAPTPGVRRETRTRILTLGGPYVGTPMVATSRFAADFAEAIGMRSVDLQVAKARTRGVAEMAWQNPDLIYLNTEIAKLKPAAEIYAVAGQNDSLVPMASACPAGIPCRILAGADHAGLMRPFADQGFERYFHAVISGAKVP